MRDFLKIAVGQFNAPCPQKIEAATLIRCIKGEEFDIAAVSELAPDALTSISSEISDALPRALDRIKLLRKRYNQTIHDAVFPSEIGMNFMDQGLK